MAFGVTTWYKSPELEEKMFDAIFTKEELKQAGVLSVKDIFGDTSAEATKLLAEKVWEHHGGEAIAEKLSNSGLKWCVYCDFRRQVSYPYIEILSSSGNFELMLYEEHFSISDATGIFKEFGLSKEKMQEVSLLNAYSAANDLSREWLLDIEHFPGKGEREEFLKQHNVNKEVHEYTDEIISAVSEYFDVITNYNNMLGKYPVIENDFLKQNFDVIIGINGQGE